MLSELCLELKNWFDRGQPKMFGDFEISDGKITDDIFKSKIQNGQYFRIIGSVFNDGVYCFNEEIELRDEKFHGAIWFMAVPQGVVNLSLEIEDWMSKYGGVDSAAMSPFNSESFAGYSYSKGSGSSTSSGALSNPNSWQAVYANRINRWRKI